MDVIIIIQSRMGSSRFPGKSFYKFNGKPALQHHIDSLLQLFDKKQVIVATSEKKENDVIRKFCSENNIECYSGDEDNVASRFYETAKQRECDYFIRINGDSPLIDYRVIESGLQIVKNEDKYDMVTTMSSNFPSGMNMEIVNAATFIAEYPKFNHEGDFEHVTKYLKDNRENHTILFLKCSIPNGIDYKFSFDTKEDLAVIEAIFKQMDKPHYEYTLEEKCRMHDKTITN